MYGGILLKNKKPIDKIQYNHTCKEEEDDEKFQNTRSQDGD